MANPTHEDETVPILFTHYEITLTRVAMLSHLTTLKTRHPKDVYERRLEELKPLLARLWEHRIVLEDKPT